MILKVIRSFKQINSRRTRRCAMSQKLVEYFNKQPRLGTLSTANKEGKVDVAYFGSPVMTDHKTVSMGLGNNRTLKNLQENPNAVYMIMEPGEKVTSATPPDGSSMRSVRRLPRRWVPRPPTR
jgi:hypothetical protein